jgi:type IV secretion system protein VirB2
MRHLSKLIFALTVMLPNYALAQSANWIEPASKLAETLQSGLVQIGGPIVGIGVVVIGIWAGVTGRMQWERVGMVIVGGLLITVGPATITALLAA